MNCSAVSSGAKVFIVGVAGGSASGKTTFANELYLMCGKDKAAIISVDSYYHAQHHMPLLERAKTNYDHPSQFDFDLLESHLIALKRGEGVDVPVYDYSIHDRSEKFTTVKPLPLIIVEGIFALYSERIRKYYDLSVFIELVDAERFNRRLQRDVRERGRTEESVHEQWITSVQPGYAQFAEPTKAFADLIGSGFEFDHHTANEVLKRAGINCSL